MFPDGREITQEAIIAREGVTGHATVESAMPLKVHELFGDVHIELVRNGQAYRNFRIPAQNIRFFIGDGDAVKLASIVEGFTSGSSISYAKIRSSYLSNPAFTRYEHLDTLVPWLFNGSTFISYDDPQSISVKARYIKDTGLVGAAIWELSQNADGTLFNSLNESMQ